MSSPTRTGNSTGGTDDAAASARLDRSKMRKIATASVIGTTVEWYDLFLFGTASALVFNQVFFPELSPALGTILAFLTFAAAYLARTVGAVLFTTIVAGLVLTLPGGRYQRFGDDLRRRPPRDSRAGGLGR